MKKENEGWGKSPVSCKWHYFRNGMSLCRKIGFYLGPVEQGSDNSPDNCAQCKKLFGTRVTITLEEPESKAKETKMKKETVAEWTLHESDNRVIWMEPIESDGLPPAIQRREKNFPAGTKITITAEIPEPPTERVVLPEGMAWDIAELLWTADGTLIASARYGNSWYCVPFMLLKITIDSCANREDTKQVIENALAEHGYFGVKKVVDNANT